MPTSNPELQMAEAFVRDTNCHIYLTGKAGTGKTTFLHNIQKKSNKRMVVTAPTGVAAINAGGVTLHSFFQLPFGPYVPGSEVQSGRYRMRREKQNIIRSLDLLIIDEISMVRADLLDSVDAVLRRYRRNERPFGGVQLLMIGDLHQLPPVVKRDEWQLLNGYYDSPYFFSSTALKQTELICIELKHIYRQSDSHFIQLLNLVRDGRFEADTFERLNARYDSNASFKGKKGYVTLCTHNNSADAINRARLEALSGRSRQFHAELDGDFPEHAFPTDPTLALKTGAQVMFIRNDMAPEKRFYNGKTGEITQMTGDTVEVYCQEDGSTIEVERSTWENIEYTIDAETAEVSQKVIGTFRQYPLKLAWAITIHKSQGLTFDKAIIDAEAAFAHGQVYVALSRCRTLEGIILSSPLSREAVRTDVTVRQFGQDTAEKMPTEEKLEVEQCRYQQQLLQTCYSFDGLQRLLGRLAWVLRENAGLVQVSADTAVAHVQQRAKAEILDVGEKFKRQLQGMCSDCRQPVDEPAVQERLTKAGAYFKEKFADILLSFLDSFSLESDNRQIKRRINDTAKLLQEETAAKLAGILACADRFIPETYLRAVATAAMAVNTVKAKAETVAYSEADVGHPELFERLRAWRKQKAEEEGVAHFQILHQKTLVQIAVHMPDTIKAFKKIKGIGPRLTEKYGEELTAMVADYRCTHNIDEVALPEAAAPRPSQKSKANAKQGPKENTKEISLEMFQKGLSIKEIAAQRELVTNTIEGHLAFFVARGDLPIDRLVADDKRRTIEKTIAGMGDTPLKALKTALGDDVSYGEIMLVQAHLSRRG